MPCRHNPDPFRNLYGLKLIAVFLHPILIIQRGNRKIGCGHFQCGAGLRNSGCQIDAIGKTAASFSSLTPAGPANTATAVAISGQIGWIGLVIPHVARMLVGPAFAHLLPTAMLLGGAYLLVVDTLARSLGTVETPLGILTALLGAPFFLWLLARGRSGWA